jgi:hypothetical protein
MSAHENESMLRAYLVCREKQRETGKRQARGTSTRCTNNSDPIKKELHGMSARANYIDRETAACWRSDCQLLRIESAMWSA